MPLRIVRSSSNVALWDACVARFLDALGAGIGPRGYPACIWLTHRIQRDRLYESAARRGLRGWLAPPVSFFSDLPGRFGIEGRAVPYLRRRMLIGRLAAHHGERLGIEAPVGPWRLGIASDLDRVFGELLPEAVTPDRLAAALEPLAGDDFARKRNEWVVAVYRDYLGELDDQGVYDPRAIHALIAARVRGGDLRAALNGAGALHIYGLTSLRSRRGLIHAFGEQDEVEVSLYLPAEDEPGEWDELAGDAETLPARPPPAVTVQPAPDARRELEWVAGRIKKLIVEEGFEPHEIAVIARIGRDDARAAHEIFHRAGIPNSARVRRPLSEIPALRTLLQLFRAAVRGWPYRPLRDVLASAYFDLDIDLRTIDEIAQGRRVEGLAAWIDEVRRSIEDLEASDDRGSGAGPGAAEGPISAQDAGVANDGAAGERRPTAVPELNAPSEHPRLTRLRQDRDTLRRLRAAVEPLAEPRSPRAWIETTRTLLDPGLFDFRERICWGGGERPEIVRFDQRGVEGLDRLLHQWQAFEDAEGAPISAAEWYTRLRRFLDSTELALSTPMQKGVQILEAHEAALQPFRRAFVIHANDGVFPRRTGPGPIFSDEERARLREAGLPLQDRETALRRERTLWRAVTANPNVILTYRTADAEGTPLLPSLMVPPHDEADEIPRTRFAWREPFSRVQSRRTAAARLAEWARAIEREPVRTAEPGALRRAILAAYGETRRRGSEATGRPPGVPGPWNGRIRDEAVLRRLRERFHDGYVWSAKQLELYGGCPMHFLIQRVLWIDERAEADEATTPLTFGTLAHEILQKFYHAFDGDYPPSFDAAAAAVYGRVVDAVLRAAEERARAGEEWLGLPPLWAVGRESLRRRVREYLEWELPYLAEKGERPVEFERSFGYREPPAEIAGPDLDDVHRRMALSGRIDRIDRVGGNDDPGYEILDYKSSSIPPRAGYEDGGVLQVPLYMEVLARRDGRNVTAGRYRAIKKPGRPQNGARMRYGDERFRSALRIAFTLPDRVRRGRFEAVAAESVGWPFYLPGRDVCRTDAVGDGSRFHA